jgi:hypothetical protein
MSRSWNGEKLVDEFSALLGDTSTAFKARVLEYINDTIQEIHVFHNWHFAKVKGKKILSEGVEEHSLEIEPPEACDIELDDDGSLTANTTYSVLFTYVQDNGVESMAGEATDEVTTSDSQKTISLENIPTSNESLVTKRNVYVKKGDNPYYYHSTLEDNFDTALVIDTDPDSTIEPPDYESIRLITGNPFFESTTTSGYLRHRAVDQLRMLAQGEWETGTPEFFDAIADNSIITYPVPSTEMEISFYYYRNPFRVYYDEDSQPDLPSYFKPILKAGVIAKGYEYRDRDGQVEKLNIFNSQLQNAVSKFGKGADVEYVIRDVNGNFDGFEVN